MALRNYGDEEMIFLLLFIFSHAGSALTCVMPPLFGFAFNSMYGFNAKLGFLILVNFVTLNNLVNKHMDCVVFPMRGSVLSIVV